MLRTGSNSGFSLIELMLTVCFVMLGSLLIQGTFMRAADMYGRYTHTLQAQLRMDQANAVALEQFQYGDGTIGDQNGTWDLQGKTCEWSQDIRAEGGSGLYAIVSKARWAESGKPLELQSELYVYKKDLV